jgi:hypothetical protein
MAILRAPALRLWLRDMQAHARFLRERGGFAQVKVLTTVTTRRRR